MADVPVAPAVRMRAIVKSFGPVEVLKCVDMDIVAGEVHALGARTGRASPH